LAKEPLRGKIISVGLIFLNRKFWLFALLSALALRLAMLALPSFSTDTQRFLSDGINVANGKNPYTTPPPITIEYPHLRSFYPPLQQAFFGAAAKIYSSPFVFRLLGGITELVFLFWFIKRKKKYLAAQPVSGQSTGIAAMRPSPARWVILFLLFNPVSIHEIWREGHLDHIGAFLLYFAIVSARAAFGRTQNVLRRYFYTFAGIGWKFTGILAPAFFLPHAVKPGWQSLLWRASSLFAVGCGLFFVLQLLPGVLLTPFAERGFLVYTQYWHHGNAIVHLLEAFGFAAAHGVYLVQRGILLLFVLSALLYVLRRWHFYEMLYFSLSALVVLFPVQHPWYYFLLFPVILLSRQWRPLLMLLCLAAPLSYLGYVAQWKSAGFLATSALWLGGCIIHFTRRSQYRLR